MQERGDVGEEPLQPHVLRLARGFDLAADVEVADPAGQLGHRDGGVHPFADIEVAGPRLVAGWQRAAVGDQPGRNDWYYPGCANQEEGPADRRADAPQGRRP